MLVALLEIKNSAYEIEIQTISFELLDLGQTVSEGTIGGDKKYVLLAQVERLDTWVERYERVRVQHGLAQTELVQKLREAKQRVVDAALEFLRFTELDAGQSVILHQREEMQEARNNLKTVIRHAIEDEMMELRRHKQQVDESVDTTIRINHLVSLLAASLALFIGIVLSNRIGNPLMALRDTALEISRGAWHRRTQIKAGGEIGDLAESFNTMADQILKDIMVREQQEEELRLVIESSPNGLVTVDKKGQIVLVNSQMEKMFGYTRDQLVGHGIETLIPERFCMNHAEERLGYFHQPIAREMGKRGELLGLTSDGREFPVDISLSPMESKEGALVLCTVVDMTEKRRVEEALRRTQFSIDHAGDSVFWMGPDARLFDVNDSACRALGYSREELLSMTVQDIDLDMPPEAWPHHWEDLKQRRSFSLESHHRRKDGKVFPVEVTVNYMEYEGKEYNCVFVRDITERKKVEDQLKGYTKKLEKSNRELDDFTYIVSHDLKEPLRAIEAFSNFVLRDHGPVVGEKGRHYLERIKVNSERASHMIGDLLEISRLSQEEKKLREKDMGSLIDELRVRFEHQFQKKKAELVVRGELPTLVCDPVRLTEVFANLISNAVKYCDKPACRIEIGCDVVDQYYQFFVRDNGPGIESEHFKKIFQIFQRFNGNDDEEGTGVGLAIVKKLVENHRGKIWVESSLGKGSTFFFTIPLHLSVLEGNGSLNNTSPMAP